MRRRSQPLPVPRRSTHPASTWSSVLCAGRPDAHSRWRGCPARAATPRSRCRADWRCRAGAPGARRGARDRRDTRASDRRRCRHTRTGRLSVARLHLACGPASRRTRCARHRRSGSAGSRRHRSRQCRGPHRTQQGVARGEIGEQRGPADAKQQARQKTSARAGVTADSLPWRAGCGHDRRRQRRMNLDPGSAGGEGKDVAAHALGIGSQTSVSLEGAASRRRCNALSVSPRAAVVSTCCAGKCVVLTPRYAPTGVVWNVVPGSRLQAANQRALSSEILSSPRHNPLAGHVELLVAVAPIGQSACPSVKGACAAGATASGPAAYRRSA